MKPIDVGGAGRAANVGNVENIDAQNTGEAGLNVANVAQSAEDPQTVAAAKPLTRTPSNASIGDWVETDSVHSETSLDSGLAEMPFVRAKFAHWPKSAKGSYEVASQQKGAGEADSVGKSLIADFVQEALPANVRRSAMKAFVEQMLPEDTSQKATLSAEFNTILDKHGVSDKQELMALLEPLLIKYTKLAVTSESQLDSGRQSPAAARKTPSPKPTDPQATERFAYLAKPGQIGVDSAAQVASIRKDASINIDSNAAGNLVSSKMAADFSAYANAQVDRSHADLKSPELRQLCNTNRKLIAALVHDFAGITKMGMVKGTDFAKMAGMSLTMVSRATDSHIQSEPEFQNVAKGLTAEAQKDVKEWLKLKMMAIVDHANLNAKEGSGTIFNDATDNRLTSTRLAEFTGLTFTLMEFILAQQNSTAAASILQDGTFTSATGRSIFIFKEFAGLPPDQQLNKEAMAKVLLENMKAEMTAL